MSVSMNSQLRMRRTKGDGKPTAGLYEVSPVAGMLGSGLTPAAKHARLLVTVEGVNRGSVTGIEVASHLIG